jgi:hypothetical protein
MKPGPGPNEWSTDDLAVVLVLDLAPPDGFRFPWKLRVYGEPVPSRKTGERRWRTPDDALAWVSRNIPSAMRERPDDEKDLQGPVRPA